MSTYVVGVRTRSTGGLWLKKEAPPVDDTWSTKHGSSKSTNMQPTAGVCVAIMHVTLTVLAL